MKNVKWLIIISAILWVVILGLLIILIYNVLLGSVLKDINYFYYVGLIASYFGLQLVWDGIAYQYLWSNAPKWDMLANPIFIASSGIFLMLFTYKFLKLKGMRLWYDLFFKITIGVLLIGIGSVLIVPINISIYVAMVGAFITVLFCLAGVAIKKLKERSDRIYLIAWELFFIGNFLNILAGLKVLPYTVLTRLAPKVGVVFLVIFFSMALADRIKEMEFLKGVEGEKRILLKGLHDMNKKIVTTRDLNRVAMYVIEHFVGMTDYDGGCMLLINPDDSTDATIYREDGNGWSVKLDGDELESVMHHLTQTQISTLTAEGLKYLHLDERAKEVIFIPLVNYDIAIGAIILFAGDTKELKESIVEIIVDYASQVTINIGNIKMFDEISKSASTDELTKLHNRRSIFELASNYYRGTYIELPLSLMMIDIDDFKSINDTYGHMAGDKVLVEMAAIMNQVVEGHGEIGRYGGEEFMVVLPNMVEQSSVKLANDFRKAIEATDFKINDENSHLSITVSVGIAQRSKLQESVYTLCDRADFALYEAKRRGRNCVVPYKEK